MAYRRRAREASEQERLDTTNVRIISVATPARQRTFPPSPKIVLPVALLLGLLLGGAIALTLGAEAAESADHAPPVSCFGCDRIFKTLNEASEEVARSGQEPPEGVSATGRYRCTKCLNDFCGDCDLYIHDTLHTCPGCSQ